MLAVLIAALVSVLIPYRHAVATAARELAGDCICAPQGSGPKLYYADQTRRARTAQRVACAVQHRAAKVQVMYCMHSTAQVKDDWDDLDGDDILAPRLGGSTAQWPPPSSSSLHRLSYPCPADWTPARPNPLRLPASTASGTPA